MKIEVLRRMALYFSLAILVASCSRQDGGQTALPGRSVVVGIEGDVDSFNPLFAQDVTAGEINDLFFPGLMCARFDQKTGSLEYSPSLAKSWEFENGNKDVRFHLRTDVSWSDGVPVTAKDVRLTYELYGDTTVASVRQPSVGELRRSSSGSIDIGQAVEVLNDSTLFFHFDHPYPGQLFDAGLPILPAHVFEKFPRSSLRESSMTRHLPASGSFYLKTWKPLEEIVLGSNSASRLPRPAKLPQLVFRVIPDYHSRLAQLRTGEIDVLPYINAEDAMEIMKSVSEIMIVPMGERFYDAINWNNIDPSEYASSQGKHILPHPLFGSSNVRRALTLAINRKEIVESYLHSYGRECVGPISPIFQWAFNDTLTPHPFDPEGAMKLLAMEGWSDTDNDGILDKAGREFAFTLMVPAGNQLRSTIAAVVQHQLRTIKIDMKIEQVERSVFWDKVIQKKFDACIAGFSIPLQIQMDELWGGDLERSLMNIPSFRNKRVDEILHGAKRILRNSDYAGTWKEFQVILHKEQPCTFLYWLNDLVAVNKRVKGAHVGLLGVTHRAEEWYVADAAASASNGAR